MPSKYLMTTITQTPLIELDRLRDFLKQIYGIDDCQITKLTGYDDLNFRIDDVKFNQNAHSELVQRNETTFIVKFTNPLENSNSYLLDGQIALMEHLRNHDIPSPIAL
uniref:Aminoglycoside phosphotransferase domain-containing protein n=1 Tax=Panagrolaimus sp. JU765 TaxID=591449 RepID=A0AC34RKJ1_9BILA